jgi:hypothetical protein
MFVTNPEVSFPVFQFLRNQQDIDWWRHFRKTVSLLGQTRGVCQGRSCIIRGAFRIIRMKGFVATVFVS